MARGRVLLLSNGHGEDLSGALIAVALRRRGVAVAALPLVGHGEPYRRRGVTVLGRTRSFSTVRPRSQPIRSAITVAGIVG